MFGQNKGRKLIKMPPLVCLYKQPLNTTRLCFQCQLTQLERNKLLKTEDPEYICLFTRLCNDSLLFR